MRGSLAHSRLER
ncbi:hypothetical protein E2320_013839, partial [Naja naja]